MFKISKSELLSIIKEEKNKLKETKETEEIKEAKKLIHEVLEEMKPPRKNLSGRNSFTDFLNDHSQKLFALAGSKESLIDFIREKSESYSVSNVYLDRFSSRIMKARGVNAIYKIITDALLAGEGMGIKDTGI